MRTVLLCHREAALTREGLARWLASWSELAGIVEVVDPPGAAWRRLQRERRRVGWLRLADVLAFRLYSRLRLAAADRAFEAAALTRLRATYAPLAADLPVLTTREPNGAACEAFLRRLAPDLVLARVKHLLAERLFRIPKDGTFVLHPGICPEYRNSHGAFWALAQDDLERVGLTLLQIDRGVDTGPVYGYFTCRYDPVRESHAVIQQRLVLDNLDALRDRLLAVHTGTATPIDTRGRHSASWGQPWLSRYLAWKARARRRAREAAR